MAVPYPALYRYPSALLVLLYTEPRHPGDQRKRDGEGAELSGCPVNQDERTRDGEGQHFHLGKTGGALTMRFPPSTVP